MTSLLYWYARSYFGRLDYPAYLRSPAWQHKRRVMLWLAGYKCQLNAAHTRRLEVHHRTYARVGREWPGDLVVLCSECHRRQHGKSI